MKEQTQEPMTAEQLARKIIVLFSYKWSKFPYGPEATKQDIEERIVQILQAAIDADKRKIEELESKA